MLLLAVGSGCSGGERDDAAPWGPDEVVHVTTTTTTFFVLFHIHVSAVPRHLLTARQDAQ